MSQRCQLLKGEVSNLFEILHAQTDQLISGMVFGCEDNSSQEIAAERVKEDSLSDTYDAYLDSWTARKL